jgi:hypothetical protein
MIVRFLITSICILYIIRSLVRWFLPSILNSVVNKAAQQQGRQQHNYQQQQRPREGSIKIDHIPQAPKSKVPDSEGDFVDYEEIK